MDKAMYSVLNNQSNDIEVMSIEKLHSHLLMKADERLEIFDKKKHRLCAMEKMECLENIISLQNQLLEDSLNESELVSIAQDLGYCVRPW